MLPIVKDGVWLGVLHFQKTERFYLAPLLFASIRRSNLRMAVRVIYSFVTPRAGMATDVSMSVWGSAAVTLTYSPILTNSMM